MDASDLGFQSVFRLLTAGAVPDLSSEQLASRISSHLGPQTAHVDVICLCLTLCERIIARLSSPRLPQDVRMYCESVTRRLDESNLMAKLVSLIDCHDRLVSHLSAKCMAAYVTCDTCMTTGRSLWRRACAEVFHRSCPSNELDSCVWSVTAVIKGLLRGNKHDVLMKLLTSLNASLTCLYTNLLSQSSMNPLGTDARRLSVSLCAFFDLLEALSAARLRREACSSLQRTAFVESGALLHVVRCGVEYFVKKRALILLKRTVLGRAGEDWALGDVRPAGEGLNEDLQAVAWGVLQEVKAGWLQDVPVKDQPSFFGGNCDVGLGGTRKDFVMLRALSLILLKSLEVNIQAPCERGNVEVQPYLTELLSFLRHHGMSPDAHSCSWVTSVFAEQDDDIIEASKALILLHLHHKRSGSSSVPVCLWGCNPHCHFIIFLRSISFDHTVLLDFLISTETCFLEYCVRYLKLLRDDRVGCWTSCCRVGNARRTEPSSESSRTNVARPSTGSDVAASPGLRLVDYGSSDEEEVGGSNRRVNVRSGDESSDLSEFLFHKVLLCLEELKTAVSRLHSRGLFPYNPASLLKLLNNVNTSQKKT